MNILKFIKNFPISKLTSCKALSLYQSLKSWCFVDIFSTQSSYHEVIHVDSNPTQFHPTHTWTVLHFFFYIKMDKTVSVPSFFYSWTPFAPIKMEYMWTLFSLRHQSCLKLYSVLPKAVLYPRDYTLSCQVSDLIFAC